MAVSGTGTTTWNYFPTSGLLQSKLYANGQGTSYTHTLAGRPQTRTLARGSHRTTSYGTDGLPTTIQYHTDAAATTLDPSTRPVAYTYDRLATLTTLSDAAGLHTYTTTPTGRTELETITFGPLNCTTLDPEYDALLRRQSLTFTTLNAPSLTHSYRYDTASRYEKIAAGPDPATSPLATYTYHPDSNLPATTTSKTNSGATRLTLTKNLPSKGLFKILFLRLIFDGGAGVKFLFDFKPMHTFAIIKAHFSFYYHLRPYLKKRKEQPSKLTNYYNRLF